MNCPQCRAIVAAQWTKCGVCGCKPEAPASAGTPRTDAALARIIEAVSQHVARKIRLIHLVAAVKRTSMELSAIERELATSEEENRRLRKTLEIYADPGFYHACSFAFDRPTGGFDEDFSEDHGDEYYERPMPGKAARQALAPPAKP